MNGQNAFLEMFVKKLGISVSIAQEKLPSLDEAQALMMNEFGNGAYANNGSRVF